MKRLLLAAAIAVAAASAVSAQPFDGKWWKNPAVAADLNLTPEQTAEIEKIFVRSRSKLIDLKADGSFRLDQGYFD